MTPTEPANQVVTTVTEPAILGPMARVLRTVLQVVIAVAATIPAVVAVLDLPAGTSAKVVAFAGAAVIVVSAIHNVINARQAGTPMTLRKRDRGGLDVQGLLIIVILVILIIVLLNHI